MTFFRIIFFLLSLSLSTDSGWAGDWQRARADFVRAEQALAQRDFKLFRTLADSLSAYPLYPYLQYQWLKQDVSQGEPIRKFLDVFQDTRYAPLLRGKWLRALAAQQQWRDYVAEYRADGDVGLECLYHWSQYQLGNREQALRHARRLWLSGRSQPGECEPLFGALTASALMTRELLWQRFEMALQDNNRQLAEYLAHRMSGQDLVTAESWLTVDADPMAIVDEKAGLRKDKYSPPILAWGIERMAKVDAERAVAFWDGEKKNLPLDERIRNRVERRLALALAYQRKAGAYERLAGLIACDAEVREWRAKAALYEQNWQHIAAAVSGMTLEELKDARWQYWQARAFEVNGNPLEARHWYALAAEDRSFYGFLAADALAQPYRLADRPVPLAENSLNALAALPDFQAVAELRALHRDVEALRLWWFAVDKLNKEKRAEAAKLAEAWGWQQVAIKTLVKADYWDDLALRFPVRYREQVQSSADRQQLDPAVIFGVMRQESMLDHKAESPVGAKGLMQLMPRTGRQIAHEIAEALASDDSLFDPDLNIRLGAHYFRKLLRRFNGHAALASAAYNAGPARVEKWLPQAGNLPADIWVETIPFKETRKYVASVLTYAIIYQHRLHNNTLKMKDLMPAIPAG